MYNFCTLFDSNYLANGLALYESLTDNCQDFHLFIFAFDDNCYKILNDSGLRNATIISLAEFENKRLLSIKGSRSKGEYCWTSTSSTILYVLEHFNVETCTYLDADIYFFSSPAPIFEEMRNASVLITEHGYPKIYQWLESDGKYCVQFITFKNDEKGLKALNWWVDACIDWCYARLEDGKFGDQKYLDDWTDRFEGVHVLRHSGGGVAPWNVLQYRISKSNKVNLTGKEKKGHDFDIIFYHFHDLRFLETDKIQLSGAIFKLDKYVREYIYKPYIRKLISINNTLPGKNYNSRANNLSNKNVKKNLLQKIKNKFHFIFSNNYQNLFSLRFWSNNLAIVVNMLFTNFNIYSIKTFLKDE